ncbi:kinase domain protein (macronuclear) [Tetrahymena thermophila SB210]|uniref:Kinase domain protein n=1 Tax=Tetrahymena thermophila (strain SB210) TaxID=312017 RepID=Q236R3_TETTS|nr:kinase domain protein [Tetrahymena thermophila SB210]EAR92437.1 kinase domain protein [Tetrahymena thermophila SB210]|eukprot:XP_001012682.1 kinase domain protein [Tetrahymena thermophila SB210]
MSKQRSRERIQQNNQESKSNERINSLKKEFSQIQQNRQFNVQLAALSNIMKQVDHAYWDKCFSKKQMKEWEQIKSKSSRSTSPQTASISLIKSKRSEKSKEPIKSNKVVQQRQRSFSLIKPQSQGQHYLISKESKTLTDIQPIRRSFQEIPNSQTLKKIPAKSDEENIDEMDVEQENYASISQKIIPEFKIGQITMKRSRKRSYDESENEKSSQQNSDYFSYQRDLLLSNKINSQQRSMQDIQNESMKTSLYITQNSFKWSQKLQQFTSTLRKGALQNFYQNSKNKIQQDSNNQIQNNTNSKAQNYTKSTSLEINIEQQNISQNLQLLQSAETFSDLSNIYSVQQKSIIDSNSSDQNFQYYCKLDSGSFGQVDLYLLEFENKIPSKQEIQKNEKQNGGSHRNIEQKDAYYKKSSTYFQSTENEIGDFERQVKQLELNQNTIQLKQQRSHESTKEDSNGNRLQNSKLVDTSINSDIQNTPIMNKIRAKAKQLSINKQYNYQQEQLILPVAGKMIKNFNEFVRELYIMQTVQFDMMPKLIGQDIDQRILYIELGLCSLYDLKQDSLKRGYKLDDHFTFSILVNIIQAIESMLSNYNDSKQKSQPLFHSDIKPQNIVLTIKKNKQTNQSEIKLMLIDFGGASFELEDYWSYYTPAFVSPYLWERLVNSKFKQDFLTWPEVRYAEVYAACRTVQYLMLEERHKDLFKKENCQIFIRQYEVSYPKTCKILEKVYQSIQDYKIFSDYKNVFNNQDFYSINQRIDFNQEKIFEISKFYQVIQNI